MGRGAGWWVVSIVGLLACGPGVPEALNGGISDPDDVHQELPPDRPRDTATDAGPRPVPVGQFPPVQSTVPTFSLELSPEDLEKLEADPSSNVSVPCTVTLEGVRVPGRMRYRGASTRDLPQKSYKIELDPGHELGDRDHFELLASWFDGGKLTEKFAVDLYRALGLPVPKARYARVSVNGEHQGLYLDMEHVGKDWLKHHRRERDASIYRCGHRNCELTLRPGPHQSNFEKKTNEDTGREDLAAFLAWVNRSDDARFEEELEQRVDVEAYLGNLAADALISNNILEDSRSFWVHELHADRWTYVPWDLNNARMLYWRTWNPLSTPVVDRWPQSFTLSRNGGEVGVFSRERRSEETGKPVLYGPEDAVWYGPLPAGTVYGRKSGGASEDFERRTP